MEVEEGEGVSRSLIRDFIRPAVRAIPTRLARELAPCRVRIVPRLGSRRVASRWTAVEHGLEILLAAEGREDHDVAMELLVCLGQALWERLSATRRKQYWLLLDGEIRGGVRGEIDEDALQEKMRLLSGVRSARSRARLERYGAASFAGTAAEYVHALWHDVTVRTGPDFLAPEPLRRRLELLSRWYPPGRGYSLFPG